MCNLKSDDIAIFPGFKRRIEKYENVEKAEFLPRFFKVGPGDYGEGDQFIGITVPQQRLMTGRKDDSTLRIYEKTGFSRGEKTGFITRL